MTIPDNPRMVALGDSMTLGRDDQNPEGGWLGWVPRLALMLGIPGEHVANTAAEGAVAADLAARQIPLVRDARPEIVAVGCGMNDVIGGFSPDQATQELDNAFTWATSTGALVVTTTLLPRWEKLPISRLRRTRLGRELDIFNDLLRSLAGRHDALCLEPASLPEVSDPGHWSSDGIHLSSSGHRVIAEGMGKLVRSRAPLEVTTRISLGLGW